MARLNFNRLPIDAEATRARKDGAIIYRMAEQPKGRTYKPGGKRERARHARHEATRLAKAGTP